MIRMNTDAGQITVDSAVYTNIAGFAATNCFGVKGCLLYTSPSPRDW